MTEDIIKIGDKVRMTAEAIAQGLDGSYFGYWKPSSTGIVKRITKRGLLVILRTNRKTPGTYHKRFWETIP